MELNRSAFGPVLLALTVLLFAILGLASGHDVGRARRARPRPAPQAFGRPSPERVAAAVARIRGHALERVPRVTWVTPAQQARRVAHAKRQARRHAAAHPKQAHRAHLRAKRSVELLTLFGVVPPSFSVGKSVTALGGDVQGTYAPGDRRIHVVESLGETRAQLAITLAHELDHATDAQLHPRIFRALGKRHGERGLAQTAVVEGTATVVEERFARRVFGTGTGSSSQLLSADNGGFGIPPALAAEFRFPYTSGAAFIRSLYRRAHGWRLVDNAFRRPPVNTEQILQPGRWLAGDTARPVDVRVGAAMPAFWRRVYDTGSGELDATILLALGNPADVAQADTRNWDGGRFELWQGPGATGCKSPCRRRDAAVLAYRWDDPASAARFESALPAYLAGAVHARRRGPLVWAVGGGYASIALDRLGTAVAFAPSPGLAKRMALAAAHSAE